MRKTIAVAVASGVVVAAMVAGTAAYASLDKAVRISDDGKVTTVHTFATSVQGVLKRAGISVGPHDSVTPSVSARIRDGGTIEIERGRLLNLTVDGKTRQVWVTARSVDAALRQVGLRTAGAVLSADRSGRVPLSGMSIDVELPHTITVHVDGSDHVIVTTQATVAGALAEAGISVGAADKVSVPLQTRPVDGLAVTIVRVTTSTTSESSPVPFARVTTNDPNSYVGTTKVVQDGKSGTRVRTYQLTLEDGKQVSKKLVSDQVSVQPVAQVTAIGTKPKPKPKPVVYPTSAGGLNWSALARCESGGRPGIANPPYYGMYQFTLGTWQAVGGSGLPSDASASEQTYRAQLLYQRSDWRSQWPVCGHLLFS